MEFNQHTLHALLRSSHIAVGCLALIVFWLPIFAKKGGPLHLRGGRVFVWCAYYVAATAAVSCTWGLVHPLSFTGITRDLTSEELQQLTQGVRFLLAILGTLMTWLVSGLQMGVHVVRQQSEPHQHAKVVRLSLAMAGCVSAALLVFGLAHLSMDKPKYLVPVTLGVVGIFDTRKNLAYLRTGPPTPKGWWYMHMECMLSSGIAVYTAFFVFGFTRLLGLEFQGALAMLPWILPTAIGIPAISRWTRKYKRKFGELPE